MSQEISPPHEASGETLNPYAPPKSTIEPAGSNPEQLFFTTSSFKLAVMSICTFGLYEVYWFYRNWVLVKPRATSVVSPIWRAIFAPLWAYKLFDQVVKDANENDVRAPLPIGPLTMAYVVLHGTNLLPEPWQAITLFKYIVLVPVNNVALNVNLRAADGFVNNTRFSIWNWMAILTGSLIIVFVLVGTYFIFL